MQTGKALAQKHVTVIEDLTKFEKELGELQNTAKTLNHEVKRTENHLREFRKEDRTNANNLITVQRSINQLKRQKIFI